MNTHFRDLLLPSPAFPLFIMVQLFYSVGLLNVHVAWLSWIIWAFANVCLKYQETSVFTCVL